MTSRARLHAALAQAKEKCRATIGAIAIWVGLAILILDGVATYVNMSALAARSEGRKQRRSLASELQETLTALTDAETGQRGYLLTGNTTYLQPYQAALQVTDQKSTRLEDLIGVMPDQRPNLAALRDLIAAKLAELRKTILLQQQHGSEAALQVVQSNQGQQLMEEIRGLVSDMKAAIQSEVEADDRQVAVLSTRTMAWGVFGSLFAAVLFGSVLFMLRRTIAKGKRADEQAQVLADSVEASRLEALRQSDAAIAMLGQQAQELASSVEISRVQTLRQSETEIETLGQQARDLADFVETLRKQTLVQSDQEIATLEDKARELARSVEMSRKQALRQSSTEIQALGDQARIVARSVEALRQQTVLRSARDVEERGEQARVRAQSVETEHEKVLLQLNQQLEQRVLERTGQLEAANKELESFSYSVSHELRSPLRAIDGFSRMILEDYADGMSAEAKGYLQRVRDNTRQMGKLVDDLLAFARLGRQALTMHSTNVGALVQQCLLELKKEQEGRRVEFTVGAMGACNADPSLLKQVWMNLLSNALKYTRKCEVALVEIGCSAEPKRSTNGHRAAPGGGDTETVYFVKDNGAGFDMKYAHKLFGVFQRLHRAADYDGTGVGLAIVQRVVQRHGGRIWATAQPNQGATFSFTLE